MAADVFGFLVTPSRTKISQSAEDLGYWAKRPEADVRRVLDAPARSERRILREEDGRYELYHDVLAEAVYDWSSRNQERRRLVETRRNRLRRWRRRGLLGFAWVVCAAVAIAIVQRIGGDDAGRSPAVTARQLAESSGKWLDTDPERSVLLGLAALDRDPSSLAIDVPVPRSARDCSGRRVAVEGRQPEQDAPLGVRVEPLARRLRELPGGHSRAAPRGSAPPMR